VSDQIQSRPTGAAWTAFIIVVAISLLSTFTINNPNEISATGPAQPFTAEGPTGEGLTDGADPSAPQGPSSRRVIVDGQEGVDGTSASEIGGDADSLGAKGRADCAKGENAGASDKGISDNEIRLAATVVKSGPAKSFLADAQFGIEAVRRKVNASGGICGRTLKIDYQDDGWDQTAGAGIITKWIGEGNHFALIVNPSSEGLRSVQKRGGAIEQNEFPVVGADGMLIGQYRNPWIWPVAASTHSVMHVMAQDAASRGAKTFAIVWETNYRFGKEGSDAFKQVVNKHCPGCTLVADKGINGGQSSYKNDANDFVGDCTDQKTFDKCDFVAVLLEPATAAQWVKDNGLGSGDDKPERGIGAPQPLFVDEFVRDNCGKPCAGMWVWTSFKPPIAPFDTEEAVTTYVNDVRAVSTSADVNNPHVQGAYVGASLLVEALRQLGPAPTRAALKQLLDQMTFDSKLGQPLTFSADNHFAAISAQPFEAVYNITGSGATFSSWRHVKDFLDDPYVTEALPSDE